MKKIATILLSLLLIGICFSSCEGMLDMKPENTIPQSEALKTLDGNLATLTSCYSILQVPPFYGRTMLCVPELLADNAKIAAQNTNRYVNEAKNLAGYHTNNWLYSWRVISSANYVIKYIDGVQVIASDSEFENKRKRAKGESYFMRGWQLFDLAKTYSREPGHSVLGFNWGVPIITEPFEYNGNLPDLHVKRATIDDTYTQIIKDLTEAFNTLYAVDGAKGPNYPYRATALAAKAALARVYLYAGKWEDAVAAATWVIDNAGFSLESNSYKDIFAKDSESILSIKYTSGNNKTFNSIQSIYSRDQVENKDAEGYFIDNRKGSGYGDVLFTEDLYAMFDAGDMRLSTLRKVKQASSEKGIWVEKFMGWQGTFGLDNIPLFRLSEMYLIRAEAYLKQAAPDEGKALIDLNMIRNARNATIHNESGSALATAIQDEKRKEFIGEGHRFFDLKRQGLAIAKSVESQQDPLTYNDYRVVARIPPGEIPPNGSNPNMIQNPGF